MIADMSASGKKRWPRAAAIAVARVMVAALEPVCDRLVIAGSLRRGKQDVGDVEVLYISKGEMRQADMFTRARVELADEVIDQLLAANVLVKRLSSIGAPTWGAKNKLAVHVESGIPVDLFAATEANWFNYLVCRTGPADLNTRIATAAQRKGWKWNPFGSGFSRGGVLAGDYEEHFVTSEEDVFRFVGLPYAEPKLRL